MSVPVKKAKLLGYGRSYTEDQTRNYMVAVDNDLNQLFAAFKSSITFQNVQVNSLISADGSLGTSANIALAKLTAGGTNGSITVKNGIITAFTNPT